MILMQRQSVIRCLSSGLTQYLSVFVEWIKLNRPLMTEPMVLLKSHKVLSTKKVCVKFETIITMLFWIKTKNSENVLMLSCIGLQPFRFLLNYVGSVLPLSVLAALFISTYSFIFTFSSLLKQTNNKTRFLFIFHGLSSAVLQTSGNLYTPSFSAIMLAS